MKKGDYLTCKEDYFDTGKTHKFAFFKKPIFKKGQRYEISGVEHYSYSNSGATYGGTTPTDYVCFRFKECAISSMQLFDIFYTQKEERNLKLKRLQTI